MLWNLGYRYKFWQFVGHKRDLKERTEEVLAQTGLSSRHAVPAGLLSYSDQRALEIAITIAGGANVVLLDEPTNDLDVDTLRALEDALLDFAGCVMVISHDRWFLDRIATHIIAFEGNSHVEFFTGNYADYEIDRRRRLGGDAHMPHRIKFRKLTRA